MTRKVSKQKRLRGREAASRHQSWGGSVPSAHHQLTAADSVCLSYDDTGAGHFSPQQLIFTDNTHNTTNNIYKAHETELSGGE